MSRAEKYERRSIFGSSKAKYSSSNISWISTRQSSCMLWKESWGMVAITASSMADSCSRMQEKEGRTWGSWSQHSGHTHTSLPLEKREDLITSGAIQE
ncbi:hypothetical protein EYF80_010320 [Liparis tanakae]|uniref:Uncharacterized protein n=1 Tax=Liparis tanakae TaxID=230148 RepID=A0A4Z2IQR1_9TELE|nr:hypothetical protein EYF80_010320 [Liparis tanakae]